jgi:hypothetical protein
MICVVLRSTGLPVLTWQTLCYALSISTMETIHLLLAYADRRASNLVETAVLDVCYPRAAVQSTRTSRLDDFVRRGCLRDFDLIVVGADDLSQGAEPGTLASADEVAKCIEMVREQHSTPIIALTSSVNCGESLLQAGADVVLPLPLNPEQLKSELRVLLDVNEFVEGHETSHWHGLGSILRGFERAESS